MEFMIQQLTSVVTELEEPEVENIADGLGEDQSAEIDSVTDGMICLVKTAPSTSNIPSEQLIFYDKLKKRKEKQISNEAQHDSFVHTGFKKSTFLGWRDCEMNVPRNLRPK